ncbi:uncharacterized protein LOC111058654 [Nilaparvata lugens]|uniref:uncharacterized protein LOC111058654 n=1 Tax=Nilaparvata lugens TaxID=108931 RepID=UPI000B98B829|nr:uncharacterized protein LOC111058654 [Nilaparvata lugens]XP_039286047.1 uncharacterized protein LOC111058654 [Nilaparvata lugens]
MNPDMDDELEIELSELIVPGAERKNGFKTSLESTYYNTPHPRLKNPPPICNFCNKKFCNLNYVKKHIERVHNKTDKPFKKSKLEEVEEKPKQKYLRCEHCTQIFNSIAYLTKHTAIEHQIYVNNDPKKEEEHEIYMENEIYDNNGPEPVAEDDDDDMRDSDDVVLLILNDTQAPITTGDSVKKILTTNETIVESSGATFTRIGEEKFTRVGGDKMESCEKSFTRIGEGVSYGGGAGTTSNVDGNLRISYEKNEGTTSRVDGGNLRISYENNWGKVSVVNEENLRISYEDNRGTSEAKNDDGKLEISFESNGGAATRNEDGNLRIGYKNNGGNDKLRVGLCNNDKLEDENEDVKLRVSYNGEENDSIGTRSRTLRRAVKTEAMEKRRQFQILEKTRHAKRRKKHERTFFEVKKLGSRGRAPNPKVMDELKVNSLVCKECDKPFTSTFNLKRHIKTHTDTTCYKKISKCSICEDTMRTDDLKSHYKSAHDTDFEEDVMYFGSKDEFLQWKENMESETVAKYVQNQAPRTNKDGSKVTYFICHRNGFYKPKGKNIRRMKLYGSNKIGSHCPSAIVVKETSYKITARFYKTHIGHSMDLSRLSLSNKEKKEIAQKIAAKVPLEDILNDIRDSLYNEHVKRIHLTTKTDLHNLIAKFKLNRNEIKNDSEYKTVDSWVTTHLSSSMIRLYKNQGDILEAFPQLTQQDFCLIVANDAQISLLHKYGNYVVCVDNTHGLDSFGFEMFSILVVDELGEGIPCALMFTTRNDTAILQVFYLVIRSALSGLNLEPCYFMSDLDEASYAAWLGVFPCKETQRLFSSWHIDEAWRTQIDKIKTKEPIIKANIYKQAKMLMNEKNLMTFDMMASNFLHELFANEETRSFGSYMEVFINDPQTWAYAHRLYKGIDASIHLENMHRNLKQIFFKGKKLKRLDRGIQAIMRFVKEKMFDRLVATEKGELSKKLLDIKARHTTAAEISTNMTPFIKQEGPGEWTILSKKNLKDLYTVSWRKDGCRCGLRCETCEICLHSYSCTCPDAAFHWNMCKHIHLIAMELKEQERNDEQHQQVHQHVDPQVMQHVDMDDNIVTDDVFEMTPDVTTVMNNTIVTQSVTVTHPGTVIESHPVTVTISHHTPAPPEISIETQKSELLLMLQQLLNVTDTQERVDTFRKHLHLVEQSYNEELITHSQEQSQVIPEEINKKLYVHKLYLRNNGNNNQQEDNNT